MIIKDIFGWLIPFLLGGSVSVIGLLVRQTKKRNTEDKSIKDGLQCLLRSEIIRDYDKYSERKHCPLYAKEALKRAYDSYHNLGGNDVATDLYKKTMALPCDAPDERS